MRGSITSAYSWLAEGLWFLIGLSFFNFCFLLDEPLFDFSDWSVVHIVCLLIGLISIITENKVSASLGQWVPKDLTVMEGILTFWLTSELYVVLIIAVSSLHFLVPAEIELFELTELMQYLFDWILGPMLFVFIFSLFANLFAVSLAMTVDWARSDTLVAHLVLIVLILLVSWVLLFWDLATSSLSAWIVTLDTDDFYKQPSSGTVYDNWVGVVDVFDWHKASSSPQAMSFDELFSFFATLIALFSTTITLFWWVYLGLAFLWGTPATLSHAILGVGMRLLDSQYWLLCLGYFPMMLALFRLTLRTPGEYFFD